MDWWDGGAVGAFWGSPLASQVEPSDEGAFRRLFWMYDELDRLRQAIEETGRVVEGQSGSAASESALQAG